MLGRLHLTSRKVRTTRTLAPNACGGKFERNLPFTTPEFPWGRVTRLAKQRRSWATNQSEVSWKLTPRLHGPSSPGSPASPCRCMRHAENSAFIPVRVPRRSNIPCRGRTGHPPSLRHLQSGGGTCLGWSYAWSACGQGHGPSNRVCSMMRTHEPSSPQRILCQKPEKRAYEEAGAIVSAGKPSKMVQVKSAVIQSSRSASNPSLPP